MVLMDSIKENRPKESGPNRRDSHGVVASRTTWAAMLPDVKMPPCRASGRRDSRLSLCAIHFIPPVLTIGRGGDASATQFGGNPRIDAVRLEFAAHHCAGTNHT